MLTYDEALSIARKEKSRINHCVEYADAYMFSFETDEESDGGDPPIVVMKQTGETMNMSAYIWQPGKKFIRDFKVE